MKYDDPLHVLDDLTGSEDDLLGSVRDLFPEKEAKKEGPQEGPKQKSITVTLYPDPGKRSSPWRVIPCRTDSCVAGRWEVMSGEKCTGSSKG